MIRTCKEVDVYTYDISCIPVGKTIFFKERTTRRATEKACIKAVESVCMD
jgi:hypothetical protein